MLLTFIILQRTDKLISIQSRANNDPLAGRSIKTHFDVFTGIRQQLGLCSHCLLLLYFGGRGVGGYVRLLVHCSCCTLQFCNHLAEKGGAGCFTTIVLLLTCNLYMFCVSSLRCHGLVCSV